MDKRHPRAFWHTFWLVFWHTFQYHRPMGNDTDTDTATDKVLENRCRRVADRRGLALVKSRRRDRQAIDYGRFHLVDVWTNTIVAGELNSPRALTLEEVAAYLGLDDGPGSRTQKAEKPEKATGTKRGPRAKGKG